MKAIKTKMKSFDSRMEAFDSKFVTLDQKIDFLCRKIDENNASPQASHREGSSIFPVPEPDIGVGGPLQVDHVIAMEQLQADDIQG